MKKGIKYMIQQSIIIYIHICFLNNLELIIESRESNRNKKIFDHITHLNSFHFVWCQIS